jgi:hypothetical protein
MKKTIRTRDLYTFCIHLEKNLHPPLEDHNFHSSRLELKFSWKNWTENMYLNEAQGREVRGTCTEKQPSLLKVPQKITNEREKL